MGIEDTLEHIENEVHEIKLVVFQLRDMLIKIKQVDRSDKEKRIKDTMTEQELDDIRVADECDGTLKGCSLNEK
jgi:hypothetical protein